MAHIDSMVQARGGGGDHEMTGHMAHMHKMMEHMEGMHGMAGHGGAGPHVVLLRGNAKIVLKCAAHNSTTDCVNAAIVLLNHTAEKDETTRAKSRNCRKQLPALPLRQRLRLACRRVRSRISGSGLASRRPCPFARPRKS